MPRILIDLEFDGAGFAGTQYQHGERTVQGVVSEVLAGLCGSTVLARPASRLDKGVSARSLPIDAWVDQLPGRPGDAQSGARCLGLAIAGRLPDDASVRRIAVVPDAFNAQFRAVRKTYSYTVVVRGTKPVLDRRCWWVKRIDHPARLQQLADQLIGTRDLRTFACLRRDGSDEEDGARTILDARWGGEPSRLVFSITGEGFLYKQIRGFVGAMVHVAQDRRTMAEFAALVAGDGSVRRMGNLAPPEGLMLEQVAFDPEPAWIAVEPSPFPAAAGP